MSPFFFSFFFQHQEGAGNLCLGRLACLLSTNREQEYNMTFSPYLLHPLIWPQGRCSVTVLVLRYTLPSSAVFFLFDHQWKLYIWRLTNHCRRTSPTNVLVGLVPRLIDQNILNKYKPLRRSQLIASAAAGSILFIMRSTTLGSGPLLTHSTAVRGYCPAVTHLVNY